MRKYLPCLFAHFLPLIGGNLVKCQKHFPCLITYFLLLPDRNIWSDSDNKILQNIQHSDILYNIGLTVHDLVHHVEHNATRSLVLCVCFVNHCLTFCSFSFGHCVVFFDIRILITPFGIFKLFCSTYNKLYNIL